MKLLIVDKLLRNNNNNSVIMTAFMLKRSRHLGLQSYMNYAFKASKTRKHTSGTVRRYIKPDILPILNED